MTLKKNFVKEFSDSTHGIQGIAQTLRWFCELIILLIEHFEGTTEVQLNSWWKTDIKYFYNNFASVKFQVC